MLLALLIINRTASPLCFAAKYISRPSPATNELSILPYSFRRRFIDKPGWGTYITFNYSTDARVSIAHYIRVYSSSRVSQISMREITFSDAR